MLQLPKLCCNCLSIVLQLPMLQLAICNCLCCNLQFAIVSICNLQFAICNLQLPTLQFSICNCQLPMLQFAICNCLCCKIIHEMYCWQLNHRPDYDHRGIRLIPNCSSYQTRVCTEHCRYSLREDGGQVNADSRSPSL